MTWTEISKNSDALKTSLEEALSQRYKRSRGKSFISDSGDKFALFTFSEPEIAVGIEYNDEDDGDLFYPSDYSGVDQMVQDMIKEIEG